MPANAGAVPAYPDPYMSIGGDLLDGEISNIGRPKSADPVFYLSIDHAFMWIFGALIAYRPALRFINDKVEEEILIPVLSRKKR